jgi:septum formation protein
MPRSSQNRQLILASSSPYRKMMLERLGIPFDTCPPAVDETPHTGETARRLVRRLAAAKADDVARRFPAGVIIGSDQVAVHQGQIVGKPGTAARARRQLGQFSGSRVDFLSAIAVRCLDSGFRYQAVIPTRVTFRSLSAAEIRRYVEQDRPLDCAGGFRSEASGTALLEAMQSQDPTAIIGLPLIAVAEALRQAGFAVP